MNHVSPTGMTARIFLAFLATAGFFYVNIMPAIVDGLIQGLGFTNQQAGAVASANMYGAAFGALLVVFLVRRLVWRPVALALLLVLLCVDLASLVVRDAAALTGLRFAHGLTGGMLVGLSYSIIARTHEPDRTFGVLLFVQFGLGGLGVMFLPGLVPAYGSGVLFLTLAAFSTVALVMLPFIPDYEPRAGRPPSLFSAAAWSWPLLGVLLAMFLFQGANMGLYAFIIGLGAHFGLAPDFVTNTLGVAAWVGLVGAGGVIVLSDRLGYVLPLALGIGVTAVSCWAYLFSDLAWVWIAANLAVGVTWAFTVPYLFGLASRFDSHGQTAALAGFASKMGLASGPAAFAVLLGSDDYARIIWASVFALGLCLASALAAASGQRRMGQGS